jgi:acyl carrier protein
MTISDFLRALEEALEIDPGTIKGDEPLREAGWWDSMAALVFMSLADEKLGVSITGGDLEKCSSVPDLLALLGDKISR